MRQVMRVAAMLVVCGWIEQGGAAMADSNAISGSAATERFDPWHNPKIRAWQDYPFFKKPEPTIHRTLWQDYPDIPEWGQRGRLVYKSDVFADTPAAFESTVARLKAEGVSLIHYGIIKHVTPDMVATFDKVGMPLIIRLDGQYFWGRNYNEMMSVLRPGGWDSFHNTVPNNDWYRKFPPSLAATRVMRDGQPVIEYYGSLWVQRRDLAYMHPVSIQMRDAFLRECILGEQMFDRPIDLAVGGHVSGVWWDNPGNPAVSYDTYSCDIVAKEFEKRFGAKYRALFEQEYTNRLAHLPADKRQKEETPERREAQWHAQFALWFADPPTLWMKYHDHDIQRWWEDLWANAYAGYYAWQYQYLQETLAPKLGRKHLFVGGNSKLCWTSSSWDYYLFSWPTCDLLGPNETTVVYTDKTAPGYKLALAASNGKPAGLWNSGNDVAQSEALACLGVVNNTRDGLRKFHVLNMELYHNAKPGARVAVLYHLADSLHHNEIANLCRVTDQIWRAGVPLEIITERHLHPDVLSLFDVVVVPGFQFSAAEVAALKDYLTGGGRLFLIGDNEDEQGRRLAAVLGGLAPWRDGDATVGKGRLKNVSAQLVTQAQMTAALADLDGMVCRMTQPEGANILINILTQPDRKLTGIHLVNFTGQAVSGLTVRLPPTAATATLAWISPYGGARAVTPANGLVSVPPLDAYGILVACPNTAARDALVTKNQIADFTPTSNSLAMVKHQGDIPDKQTRMEDLKPGQNLCYFRQFSKAGFRRIDADVIADGQGRVGQPLAITLKIHAVGVWDPASTFMDKIAFVMVREATGERETVPVDMETVKGKAGGESVREKDFAVPAGTFISRHSVVSWKPARTGRFQMYLAYRYVSEPDEGKPDMRADQKSYPLTDYFFSRPLLKIVYEDKLPGLSVVVTE